MNLLDTARQAAADVVKAAYDKAVAAGTLPQAELPLFHGQKALFCANNLPGCVKNSQRGRIVAGIDAQCIAHGCAGSSWGAPSSASARPDSRATLPSRPLTNW